jgi:hypothetical protein
MAQGVQKVAAPVMKVYNKVDEVTNGHAKSAVMLIVAIIVCYIIDYFTRGSPAVSTGGLSHEEGV